jgi:hypothetical protein
VNEYTYLGVRITKDGNCESEINDTINKGRADITQLKAKTTPKFNPTEMDFWRRSARISSKGKIKNNVIKK